MPRQSGYAFRIEGFIVVDPADIDRVGAVAAAIKKAQAGDLADFLPLAKLEPLELKPTSRMAPADGGAAVVMPDLVDLVPPKQLADA